MLLRALREIETFMHPEGRAQNRELVAPPKLLGLLRKNLSKTTSQLISETIPKDISWFDERELEHYLKDHGVAG